MQSCLIVDDKDLVSAKLEVDKYFERHLDAGSEELELYHLFPGR